MEYLYYLNHEPIDVYFSKNSKDFVVREVPLYDFSGDGEHLILEICKKNLTTQQALSIVSENLGVKIKDIGYCGLKDKDAMTTQFISMSKKFEKDINKISSNTGIKILNTHTHKNKLKIGHLKGNNFFIRLKKVLPKDAIILENILGNIKQYGFANYFGYQRFGKFGDNFDEAKQILSGTKKIKNPKIRDFLISAYQSFYFNKWLCKRVEFSKFFDSFSVEELYSIYKIDRDDIKSIKKQPQFFKILRGDVFSHYPFGKYFIEEDFIEVIQRFISKDITVTGPIIGKDMFNAADYANTIEKEIVPYEFISKMQGTRRFAWSWLSDLKSYYNENEGHFCIEFFLDKGSYATVVLEEILHKKIFNI